MKGLRKYHIMHNGIVSNWNIKEILSYYNKREPWEIKLCKGNQSQKTNPVWFHWHLNW